MSRYLPRRAPLALAVSLALGCSSLWAQSAASPLQTASPREVSIPAQPLGDALNAWARQTGAQLAVPQALVAGKTAPAVSGSLTPRQVLDRLLAGSGLEASISGTEVVVRRVPAPESSGGATLAPIMVTANREGPGGLPGAYAGGQVARGGRVGMLGNKDVMDTPFSQTSYTSQTIQDQQARTLQEMLANDPSVTTNTSSAGNFNETTTIRGFQDSANVGFAGSGSLNGLAGISPLMSADMDYVERVEVLRGASALLNGMAASGYGGIGGTVNLITKQADDEPLTQFTTRYANRSQFGMLLDLGRRFGERNEFGIRFNGAYRKGDTAVEPESARNGSSALSLDYRGERVRLAADLVHQENQASPMNAQRVSTSNTVGVPRAPDAGTSFNPPWSQSAARSTMAMLRGEVDISDDVTAYGAIGKQEFDYSFHGPLYPRLQDAGGTYSWSSLYNYNTHYDVLAMQGGLKARVRTGPISHELSLNLQKSELDLDIASYLGRYSATANLYNPVLGPSPFIPGAGNPERYLESRTSSAGIADTMSMLDGRVQFIAGARRQRVEQFSVSENSQYEKAVWTPALALVVKPRENVSLYVSHIEALQAGEIVSSDFANSGTVMPPYVSKQHEVGAKVDWGKLITTLALFQITRQSTTTVDGPNGGLPTLVANGRQRNRGLELNAYGEVARGVRLLGGLTLLDAVLTQTQDGLQDGNRAAGVPKFRAVIGGEWDTPFLPGLTLTGRVSYTGKQTINTTDQSPKTPAWTTLDLGARYAIASSWTKEPVVIRLNVDNALNKNYWTTTGGNVLYLGAPRTVRLSATFNF
jgi:iron complex outermembrane receptor protein